MKAHYYTTKVIDKSVLKKLVMLGLNWLGLNLLARFLTAKKPRIIMFHKVFPDGGNDLYTESIQLKLFEKLLVYCKKNYQVFTLAELVEYFEQHGVYPKYAVVITFDDGFQSFFHLVYPLLLKYQIKASIFVCPGLIDKGATIWPELVLDLFEKGALNQEVENIHSLIEELKQLNRQTREQKIQSLVKTDYRYQEGQADMNRALMNWSQLREIQASGLVEVGSHSLTHPILSRETPDEVNSEMRLSKERIEAELENKVVSFCYPNGQNEDYRETELIELEKCAYKAAVTAEFGLVSLQDNSLLLPRFGGDFTNFQQAKKYVDGFEYCQRKILDRN